MIRYAFTALVSLLLFSCSSTPYIGLTESQIEVVKRPEDSAPTEYTIPSGEGIAIRKYRKKYYHIKWEGKSGYALRPKYKKRKG